MRIAANLDVLFDDRPLLDRVLAARLAGFDGVELRHPAGVATISLAQALERAALPLARLVLEGGAQGFESALQQALTDSAMLRPQQVGVVVNARSAMDEAQLRGAAEAFAVLGIGVLCAGVSGERDAAGLLALVERVNHPNCRVQLDLSGEAEQVAAIESSAGRIGYLQLDRPPAEGGSPALLGALRSVGYRGWLGVGYRGAEAFLGGGSHRPA
ncbi:hydroxypyruvate isomerase [Stutzerimonas nosocomialis]|uniref:Hydroxypyruvate isomerase n=1 Tax=Stutzerimonas nosocomialis TaxID=1056496 RepID=A0A5R9QF88_9GAMM|nr:hydroxypyruvate isomerase [Stutzerimonas nosocomialis]TLX63578.1 hydroxypyruvate isomerase [Stutzerimonas nosocomialis]